MSEHALIRRRDAAQAVLDRFADNPHAWGSYDCGQMLLTQLRGVDHTVKLAGVGTYKTMIGAKRALRRLGYPSLTAYMDAHYPRIPPAFAIVGDVIALPSVGPLDAIGICLGNGRAIAYHESAVGAVVVQPIEMLAAWRVDP